MGVKSLDGRPKKSAIRPFNTRVREVPRRPLLADSRLSHRNIVVQCSESDQKAANGKTRPTAEVEVRALNVGYADIPDASERRER